MQFQRIRPQKLSFKAQSPFNSKDSFIEPKIWDRVDENISLGKINTIPVEGASQVGKSTFCRYFAEHYDKEFITWYSTEDVFKTMYWFKAEIERLIAENPDKDILDAIKPLMHKWIIFEEPDAETPKAKWRSERTQAVIRIINMYGFLKPNLMLSLPDLDELGSGFYRNVTFRVFINVRKKYGRLIRKATFYRPYKPVGVPKWKWYPIGEFEIPELTLTNDYFRKKIDNFFDNKINRYEKLVKYEDSKFLPKEDYIPPKLSEERIKEAEKLLGI